MKDFKYNRWLIALIIIGLLAALTVDLQRHRVERDNMTVEMAIDYEGLLELAEAEGMPAGAVLRRAKDAGITSLAVYETTFKKLNLNGKVAAVAGSEILKNYHGGSLVDPAWRKMVEQGQIKATEVYVTRHDPQTFREVREDLIRRLGAERVTALEIGAAEVLAVKANYESLLKMNLGMPTDEMKAVNEAGFYVLARPSNYHLATASDVQGVFDRMAGVRISGVVFSGSEVLGSPKQLEDTVRLFKERDFTLGMIEHPLQLQFFKQEGLLEVAKGIDYQSARVYSIPKDEQLKMKIDEAVERWVTTDEERNIRINLLRTFEQPASGLTLLETNLTYFAKTKAALEAKGFAIGKAGTFAQYFPNRILLMLMSLGAIAAGILYLTLLRPFAAKYQYLLLVLLAAIMLTPLAMGHGNMVRSAVALASANLFPALAVIWQLDRIRALRASVRVSFTKAVAAGAGALFVTGALSFIGAAYVGGVLADVEYLLEINIFRGVKLTFVLPIILVGVAFLLRFNLFDGRADRTEGIKAQCRKILNAPVYVKSLLALAAAAIVAVVFIGRSGHTSGIPVPGLELKFRAFLEGALYARPRSKELLIGHPAFMMAAFAFYKKWPSLIFFVLVIFATIGQGSLVETFAHMRTPIYMSFMRGLGGLILGAGIGVCCMMAAELWYRVSSCTGRDSREDE